MRWPHLPFFSCYELAISSQHWQKTSTYRRTHFAREQLTRQEWPAGLYKYYLRQIFHICQAPSYRRISNRGLTKPCRPSLRRWPQQKMMQAGASYELLRLCLNGTSHTLFSRAENSGYLPTAQARQSYDKMASRPILYFRLAHIDEIKSPSCHRNKITHTPIGLHYSSTSDLPSIKTELWSY